MNIKRIEQLQIALQKNPTDPFLAYAITLELLGANDEFCLASFRKLLIDFPDYLPTYYQAALLFSNHGFIEEARSTFLLGIEKTKATKNVKGLQELKNTLANFEAEQDQ